MDDRRKGKNECSGHTHTKKMHDTNGNELHFHYVFYPKKLELKKMEKQFNFKQINRIAS